MLTLQTIALDTFNETLRSMKPEKRIMQSVSMRKGNLFVNQQAIGKPKYGKIWVVGAGKASARMAAGLEAVIGKFIADGLIISPKSVSASFNRIQVLPGKHPKPDSDTIASTLELLDFCEQIPREATVIFLMSGGASSLMELPAEGISIDEISQTYDIILKSGASIHNMNLIRKHLSQVKGGKLLKKLTGRTVVNLLLSDVPGDDPRHIGSGPTNPENSSKSDARAVAESFNILTKFPPSVRDFFLNDEPVDETNLAEYHNFLLGTSLIFAQTAARSLEKSGFKTTVLEKSYDAPVEDVSKLIFSDIKKHKKGKLAFLYHGESMVNVTGTGKGGRNQHLALLLSKAIDGMDGVTILSAGTDGGDGPTDAAGAVVDGKTIQDASKLGLDADETIANFDAYHFFKSLNALIFTGPTGNNLMDFQLILINR